MSNSSHGERVVSASQCQSARHSLKKKKKNLAIGFGYTRNWRLVIEEERRSKTEKRKKENADKEEEKKVCAFHFILCGFISVFW